MQLSFGLGHAVPEGVTTAWGARMIAPADLLPDRQDLQSDSDADKAKLIEWLNGETPGRGAIYEAQEFLRDARLPQSEAVATLYEDDRGRVVGSTNASHGYVYVAGWLHNID
jgi:hypothetical protein